MARLCCDRSRVRRDRDGVDRLERVLLEQLPEGDPIFPDDYLTDQPERAWPPRWCGRSIGAHASRAAVFNRGCDDEFDERNANGAAHLLHDLGRAGVQKPIVIGRGGEMIKRIGTEARQDLERFFETKVLDLRVKVNADWRNNERTLDELGVPKRTAKPKRKRQAL